MGGAGRGSHY
ncbi:hypothetical protein E2C01_081155 [Portunus trituberculatus]|uniref:Uncharacterized protein n=1 Tax=Portunus trituberculatus TaxID=210409 RepID=A0A5B7IR70_PORTR|nr:hypothetical protein [Portunus trituberculatus]